MEVDGGGKLDDGPHSGAEEEDDSVKREIVSCTIEKDQLPLF